MGPHKFTTKSIESENKPCGVETRYTVTREQCYKTARVLPLYREKLYTYIYKQNVKI